MEPFLSQNLVQSLQLRQEQIMAPQQIQSLQILLATVPELEQRIEAELSENPTLELLEHGSERLMGNPVEEGQQDAEANGDLAAQAIEKDECLAALVQLDPTWRDHAPALPRGRGDMQDDQERHRYVLDSLVSEPTFQDLLLDQLREKDGLDEETSEICRQIIGSIDETGYLRTGLADIAQAMGLESEQIEQALEIIQSFDPPGLGARDLRECLLLQLRHKGMKGTRVHELVQDHLEAVGRNQIPQVARRMGVSISELYEILKQVKDLNPHPGRLVNSSRAEYVYPEVFVEDDGDGGWQVRSNREYIPRIRISPRYLEMLEDPATSREVKEYIREKLAGSRLLLRAIDNRQSTIEKIAESLLQLQVGFFRHGVSHMCPLTMGHVADAIGVHETTVSRAIAGKYIQTPHGLFPLRTFFTGGYEAAGGESMANVVVRGKIQDLIDDENPKRPLSDERVAQLLKGEGLKVARRTVAKYREELGVPASHMRRRF